MTVHAYDIVWFTCAYVLIVLLWPQSAKGLSNMLMRHSKAMNMLYRGLAQGVGDYLGYMGLHRRHPRDIQEMHISMDPSMATRTATELVDSIKQTRTDIRLADYLHHGLPNQGTSIDVTQHGKHPEFMVSK